MIPADRAAGDRTARFITAIAALGLGAGVCAAALRKLGDFDLPWHVAAGRAMWRARSVFLRDEFSFTHAGRPVPYEPVADGLLFAAERLGGAAGMQVLGALVIGLLAWAMVARAGADARLLGIAMAAWAVMASAIWLIVRPALLSFALLAALLWIVDRQREQASRRILYWAVPLQWVWASSHGFAVLGVLVLWIHAAHAAACRLARGRLGAALPEPDGAHAGTAALAAAAATGATCLSPFGLGVFTLAGDVRALRGLITEWQATSLTLLFRDDVPVTVLIGLGVLAAAAGREPDGTRMPRARDLVLLGGALALALLRARLIPVFAVVAAPFVARRLAGIAVGRGAVWFALASSLASAPVVMSTSPDPPGIGLNTALLPVGAVDFARRERLAGRVWNFLSFGGYLAWQGHPDIRVYIDGRTVRLYPIPFLQEYLAAEQSPPAFARLDRIHRFDWALTWASPAYRFSAAIARDPNWAMLYLDDTAAVYVRRDGANRALAARGYRVLDHLTPGGGPLVEPYPADALAHDAALATAQAPASPRAHLYAAAACLARGDRACAVVERERVAALDPAHPSLRLLDARLGRSAPR